MHAFYFVQMQFTPVDKTGVILPCWAFADWEPGCELTVHCYPFGTNHRALELIARRENRDLAEFHTGSGAGAGEPFPVHDSHGNRGS